MNFRFCISIVSLFVAAALSAAGLSFSGSPKKVLTVQPEASTGLNDIFILYATGGVSATYTAASPSAEVTWQRYSSLGGGFAEAVEGVVHNGSEWTLPAVQGDMGYIIEEGSKRYYCWVVDYSAHRFSISALTPGPDDDCSVSALIPTGHGDKIAYYGINGRRLDLDRDITLTYTTLEYDEDSGSYTPTPAEAHYEYLPEVVHAPASLCDTRFTLAGDRFLKQWGEEASASSASVAPHAVACHTSATPAEEVYDNQQSTGDDSMLGGSAPCTITFAAAVTDAAIFREWQFSTYEDFADIQNRVSELETTYTFTEQGTTFVRFMTANAAGTCEAYGDTYQVFIGDSDLQCPNAFSPGASEGVNDLWKVSYKSIISFECNIFNRYGTKMATLTHPSQGWDGRYNGHLVPAGVYYYVIKAVGSDGKKYDLSGDINIVNFK